MTRLPIRAGVFIAFVLFGGNVMAAEVSPTKPAVSDKSTDGKYYLIWRVTAPKVEVGAEVEVEPAFFTNGDKIVFAWDYCAQRYYRTNKMKLDAPKDYGRKFGTEDILDAKDLDEDLTYIHHYCDYQEFALPSKDYVLRDNYGSQARITDARFETPPLPAWQSRRLYPPILPLAGKTKLVEVAGVYEKRLPAREADQPFVFLMARDNQMLDRIMPRVDIASSETTKLLQRHDGYVSRRMADDPTGQNEVCVTYWPGKHEGGWFTNSVKSPELAETFYLDVDRDGRLDLVARFVEDKMRLAMTRIYYGNLGERCAVRNQSTGNGDSPIARPLALIVTNHCTFAYLQLDTSTHGGSSESLLPLGGEAGRCQKRHRYLRNEIH